MSNYNVDCPVCDANKTNDEPLFQHYLAVARADAQAEHIAAEIAKAAERKDVRTR